MAFFTQSRPVADGVFNRSMGFSFSDVVAKFSAWNDMRVTRRELSKLSDRELNDIGLNRSDIDALVQRLR